MPRTSGFAVKELCEAQELIAKAAQKVTAARLTTIRLSGEGDDFRGTPLDRVLGRLGGNLTEISYEPLEELIRELAALIPDREETTDAPA